MRWDPAGFAEREIAERPEAHLPPAVPARDPDRRARCGGRRAHPARPARRRRGARPGAGRGRESTGACVRVPRAQAAALSAALGEVAAGPLGPQARRGAGPGRPDRRWADRPAASLDSSPWPSSPSACSATRPAQPRDRGGRLRQGAAPARRGPHRHHARRARRRPRRAADRRRAAGLHLARRRRGRPPGQPGARAVRGEAGRAGGLPVASPSWPSSAGARCRWWPPASTCTASRCTIEGSAMLARALQHETDHLDGVLFVDRLDARGAQGRDEGDPRVGVVRRSRSRSSRSPRTPPAGSRCDPLMRVVFAGTPEVGAARRSRRSPPPATSWSASSPGPTRRAGRGRTLVRQPGRRCAASELGVPVLKPGAPPRPRLPGGAARASRPTAARWWPTARCCRSRALDIPPHGWVNLHFSVLPAWRGAAPVQHAHLGRRRGHRRHHLPDRQGARRRPDLRRDDRADPPDRHRRRPARPARRGRRRPARRHPRRHRGRRRSRPGRSRRTGSASPQDPVEDARVDWSRAGRRGSTARSAPAPRARAPGPRSTGERVKLGPVRPDADARAARPGRLAVSKNAVHVGTGTVAGPARRGQGVREEADGRRRLGARRAGGRGARFGDG